MCPTSELNIVSLVMAAKLYFPSPLMCVIQNLLVEEPIEGEKQLASYDLHFKYLKSTLLFLV